MNVLSHNSWISLSLFISLFICFGLSTAQADVKDLGDVCFTLDDGTLTPAPPVPGRVGLLLYGVGHIALDGKVGGDPVHGTAVIDGNNFVVTLNTSNVSTDFSTSSFSVFHMLVNVGTLQGTYRHLFTQTSPPPPISGVYVGGTVRFVPCN
jgi:hypothetical protein